MDRTLPGLAPGYIRIELIHEAGAGWSLTTCAAQARGFVTSADVTVYGPLSAGEAADTIGAVLDGWL